MNIIALHIVRPCSTQLANSSTNLKSGHSELFSYAATANDSKWHLQLMRLLTGACRQWQRMGGCAAPSDRAQTQQLTWNRSIQWCPHRYDMTMEPDDRPGPKGVRYSFAGHPVLRGQLCWGFREVTLSICCFLPVADIWECIYIYSLVELAYPVFQYRV